MEESHPAPFEDEESTQSGKENEPQVDQHNEMSGYICKHRSLFLPAQALLVNIVALHAASPAWAIIGNSWFCAALPPAC